MLKKVLYDARYVGRSRQKTELLSAIAPLASLRFHANITFKQNATPSNKVPRHAQSPTDRGKVSDR